MASVTTAVSIPVVLRDGSITEQSGTSMLEICQMLHRDHLGPVEVCLLDTAIHLVVDRFHHLRRASGEPLYEHSLAVFLILHRLGLSPEAQVAAILHDIVEDTPVTSVDLARWFDGKVAAQSKVAASSKGDKGGGVATTVFALTKRDNSDRGERCYIAKIALAVELGWWESAFIKVSDVVHNMMTVWGFNDRARELSYAREKQDIILPALKYCQASIPREFAEAYKALLRLAETKTAEVIAAKRPVNPHLIAF